MCVLNSSVFEEKKRGIFPFQERSPGRTPGSLSFHHCPVTENLEVHESHLLILCRLRQDLKIEKTLSQRRIVLSTICWSCVSFKLFPTIIFRTCLSSSTFAKVLFTVTSIFVQISWIIFQTNFVNLHIIISSTQLQQDNEHCEDLKNKTSHGSSFSLHQCFVVNLCFAVRFSFF